jgi:hypothetical protein
MNVLIEIIRDPTAAISIGEGGEGEEGEEAGDTIIRDLEEASPTIARLPLPKIDTIGLTEAPMAPEQFRPIT